jgi:flagellar biosynthesis protein FlhF
MNVRKFIAATARDALRKVKETLGPDAIILSNRGIPGGVEIMAVAARDMAMIVPTPARETKVASDDYTVRLSPSAAPTAAPRTLPPVQTTARSPFQPQAQRVVTPAGSTQPVAPRSAPPVDAPRPSAQLQQSVPSRTEAEVVPAAVMDEIRALRRIVEQHLAGFAWGESARSEPVKTEVLRQMLDAGFSPQFSRELLVDLPHELDAGQALAWVKGGADRSLLTITAENDIVASCGTGPARWLW